MKLTPGDRLAGHYLERLQSKRAGSASAAGSETTRQIVVMD